MSAYSMSVISSATTHYIVNNHTLNIQSFVYIYVLHFSSNVFDWPRHILCPPYVGACIDEEVHLLQRFLLWNGMKPKGFWKQDSLLCTVSMGCATMSVRSMTPSCCGIFEVLPSHNYLLAVYCHTRFSWSGQYLILHVVYILFSILLLVSSWFVISCRRLDYSLSLACIGVALFPAKFYYL